MSDTKVDTIGRLARWKIASFGAAQYIHKISDPFKIGIWNWHLAVTKNVLAYITLYLEPSRVSKEQPPVGRFILRVTTSGLNRQQFISPIYEKLLRTKDDFILPVNMHLPSCFVIDVEFLDLKISQQNGGEGSLICPSGGTMQQLSTKATPSYLARMLNESIHWDVAINTTDSTLRAHKAILSSSSPVFESMFKYDLREKESSTIDIEDMTSESCMALLRFMYGSMKQEEFWEHRLSLLAAANKYSIVGLTDAFEDSLLEDLNTSNVLERLQIAWFYQLEKLKKGCLTYLFDFEKIFDISDEMNIFIKQADRGLVEEILQEVIRVWKPA